MTGEVRAGGLGLVGLAGAGLALGLTGCGGGLPLLHPATVLPEGEVRAEAGLSANVAVGDLSNAVNAAQLDSSASGGPPTTPGSDPTYARGALVLASVGPGLAPIAGARVGIGWQSEGGLVYTGRSVRADLRRSFSLGDRWALSLEVAGSSALYGRQSGGPLYNVSLGQLHGWGADVPLLVGYESEGGLYQLWFGPRGGWEHVDISNVSTEPNNQPLGMAPVSLSATRFWGGGVLGFAIGFRHLHVAMELDAAYVTISGSYDATNVTVGGLSLAPAAALWWDF